VVYKWTQIDVRVCDDGPVHTWTVSVSPSDTDFLLLPGRAFEGYEAVQHEGERKRLRWLGAGPQQVPLQAGPPQSEILRLFVRDDSDEILAQLPGDETELLPPTLVADKQSTAESQRPALDKVVEIAEAVAAMPSPHPDEQPTPVASLEVAPKAIGRTHVVDEPRSKDSATGMRSSEEFLDEVQVYSGLLPDQRAKVVSLILELKDAFGTVNETPAKLPKFRTRLGPNFRVVYQQPRSLNSSKREALRSWLDRMVRHGLYRRVDHNEWASRVILVKKPDGCYRVCGDYVDANEQTPSDAGPMPNARQKNVKAQRLQVLPDLRHGERLSPRRAG